MNVAIVKYNAGNICSVMNAMRRLGVEPLVTDNPEQLMAADRVIFPGQGEASSTMSYLRERGLDEVIRSLRQPVLGICIGMQLMCRSSEEGNAECLGIFDTAVRRFEPDKESGVKVPHMGWNSIGNLHSPLFEGIADGAFVYFVHSYAPVLCDECIAVSANGRTFAAALAKGNFYGTQFHPEKSGDIGEAILRNFLKL